MKKKNKILVIAEAGVNHNGSLNQALKMIDTASEAGADYVKFQTFEPYELANSDLDLAKYQKQFVKKNSHLEMLKKLALKESQFKKIINRCKKKKIKFLSSPFDLKSIKLLSRLKINSLKIPSGQIDDIPYLEAVGKLKKNIFLSTGASTKYEIRKALDVLIKNGISKNKIMILHCVSQYPASIKNLNLYSIKYLRKKFKLPVGFSDHSLGFDASILAIGLGAKVIEKHFTLNKNQIGPDHKSSLSPKELNNFIRKIRLAEKSLGEFNKKPKKDELINLRYIRKKIIAKKNIKFGEKFTNKNLTTKRSAVGIAASNWKKILGKKSKKNYKLNQGIIL